MQKQSAHIATHITVYFHCAAPRNTQQRGVRASKGKVKAHCPLSLLTGHTSS